MLKCSFYHYNNFSNSVVYYACKYLKLKQICYFIEFLYMIVQYKLTIKYLGNDTVQIIEILLDTLLV